MKWNEWRDHCGLQGLERGPLRNMLSDWDSDRSEKRREITRRRQVSVDLAQALEAFPTNWEYSTLRAGDARRWCGYCEKLLPGHEDDCPDVLTRAALTAAREA
jgi:hypothetical protein